MMARFVDAHLLAKAYLDVAREEHLTGLIFLSPEDVANTILKLSEEFENVAPVVHAHWKISYCDSGYRANMICSLCDGFVTADSTDVDGYLFCPCCGAKMDEEVNNG